MAEEEIKKGLAGVVVDYTAVSKVNPDTNSLLYRGYPVQELAARCSFEEVAYLLWNGELPNSEELAAFTQRERAGRALDPVVKQVVDALPVTAHPMDVCRTAASVMGARHELAEDSSREANMAKAVDLFAAMPAIVAYDQRRLRRGVRAGGCRGLQRLDDPVRGALLQCLHLRRAGHHVHAVGPPLGGNRSHRSAQRPAARRRQRSRHAHL